MNINIFQIILTIIILLIIALILIEKYKLNNLTQKLKIEEENTKNMKKILSKYLNHNIT